jgi:alanyl-tRNA synthetase
MFGKYETLELKKEFLEGKPETYYQFFRITGDDVDSLKKAVSQGNVFLVNRMLEDFKKKNFGLAERIDELKSELEKQNLSYVSDNFDNYLKNSIDIKGIKIIRCDFKQYSSELLRNIADLIKSKVPSSAAILFSVHADRVIVILSLTSDIVEKGLDAGALIKSISPILGGGGGGKKNIAEAGGKDPSKISAAFNSLVETIKAKL